METRRKKTNQASTALLGVCVIVVSMLVFIMVMDLVVVAVRLIMG